IETKKNEAVQLLETSLHKQLASILGSIHFWVQVESELRKDNLIRDRQLNFPSNTSEHVPLPGFSLKQDMAVLQSKLAALNASDLFPYLDKIQLSISLRDSLN